MYRFNLKTCFGSSVSFPHHEIFFSASPQLPLCCLSQNHMDHSDINLKCTQIKLNKGPEKLIQQLKIVHSFLHAFLNLFNFVISSLSLYFCIWLLKEFSEPAFKMWRSRSVWYRESFSTFLENRLQCTAEFVRSYPKLLKIFFCFNCVYSSWKYVLYWY